jgi:surface carbohydrate biosynthesis protein (TIGR04326 family)
VTANYATPTVVNDDVGQTRAFNTAKPGHSVLHAYLNVRSVIGAFRDYIRIGRWGRRLRVVPDLLVEPTTGIDPSPLLAELIEDQYFGRTAALNALWIRLWESALARWPRQRLGVYLFENQPWELAFLAAWRASENGDLIGFSHSTMVFWDLRYFGGRWMEDGGRPRPPTPSRVAINGSLMRKMARDGGFSDTALVDVEALRTDFEELPHPSWSPTPKILIIGDYSIEATQRLLDVCTQSLRYSTTLSLELRPHPAWSQQDLLALGAASDAAQISLRDQIRQSSVVISGPHTSGALDATLKGIPTASLAIPSAFSGNPAESLPGFHSVRNAEELSRFITNALEPSKFSPMAALHSSEDLRLWRELLGSRHGQIAGVNGERSHNGLPEG